MSEHQRAILAWIVGLAICVPLLAAVVGVYLAIALSAWRAVLGGGA